MGLNLAITILTQPSVGFMQLRNYRLVLWAFLIVTLSNWVSIISNYSLGAAFFIGDIIVNSISTLLWFSIFVLIIYLTSKLLKGSASFVQTFQACAFANLPPILYGPISLLLILALPSTSLVIISRMIKYALMIWSMILLVISIRETHNLSTGRAIIVLIIPIIIILLLLLMGLITILL